MNKPNILGLVIFFLVIVIAGAVGGQYLGGFAFLKLAHIDTSYLQFDTLYQYAVKYKENKPVFKLVAVGIAAAAVTTLIPLALLIAVIVGSLTREELHGSARLANDMDLTRSKLFPSPKDKPNKHPEILIGKMGAGRFKGQYLRFAGQQFMYVSAPTRSGKGVGLVIPNLLNFRDSVVVLDIKLENFFFTGGFRHFEGGQEVYLFSPDGYAQSLEDKEKGVLRSHRWNCLHYVNRDPLFRDADIMVIGRILYPLTGGENDFWNDQAANLFKGLVLYMLDYEASGMPVTMPQLLKLTTPDGGIPAWMVAEIESAKMRGKPLSESCVAEFNRFLATPDRTQGNIVSSLTAPLGIFGNAACAAATSGNDFDFRDVRKKRMSIYLGMSPNSLPTYSRLINLFFSQLINENTKVLPELDPSLKYQCLLVLDEFTSMGKVEIIQKSIAYTAGYNIRYMIIIQSRSQLENDKLYGKTGAEDIITNCAVQLIYPPKEVNDEAKRVSETIGYKTVKAKSKSRTRGKSHSHGDSISDQKRAVMMPQEVVDLGRIEYKGIAKHEIVIMEKTRPFIADKIIYFDSETEPEFLRRKEFSESHVVPVPVLDFSVLSGFMVKQTNLAVPTLKETTEDVE